MYNIPYLKGKKLFRKRFTLDGVQYDVYGKTKKIVKEKIDDIINKQKQGLVVNDNSTLPEYISVWFPIYTKGKSYKTIAMYKNSINNHILPVLGNIRLQDIKAIHIQKILAECCEKSYSSQHKILLTINIILRYAKRDGLIINNPAEEFKPGGQKPKEKQPLNRQEQGLLIETSIGNHLYLFVMICLYTGLRRSEVLGLKWDNINFFNVPYVNVENSVTFEGSKSIYSTTLKTPAANRIVPIPNVLLNALVKYKEHEGFIIPSINDNLKPISQTVFKRYWNIIREQLDFHVTPHILRHTYATELVASGVDIKKVQYLLGHEDPMITLKIYAHVKNNSPEDMIDSINEIFKIKSMGGVTGGLGEKSSLLKQKKTS